MATQDSEPWAGMSTSDVDSIERLADLLLTSSLPPRALVDILDSFTAAEEKYLEQSHSSLFVFEPLPTPSEPTVSAATSSMQSSSEQGELDPDKSELDSEDSELESEDDSMDIDFSNLGAPAGQGETSLHTFRDRFFEPHGLNLDPYIQTAVPGYNLEHLTRANMTSHQDVPEFGQGSAQATHPPALAVRRVRIPPSRIASTVELMRQGNAILRNHTAISRRKDAMIVRLENITRSKAVFGAQLEATSTLVTAFNDIQQGRANAANTVLGPPEDPKAEADRKAYLDCLIAIDPITALTGITEMAYTMASRAVPGSPTNSTDAPHDPANAGTDGVVGEPFVGAGEQV